MPGLKNWMTLHMYISLAFLAPDVFRSTRNCSSRSPKMDSCNDSLQNQLINLYAIPGGVFCFILIELWDQVPKLYPGGFHFL